jgi:hypothetical protein
MRHAFLVLRGFAQVCPIAINTWQLAHEKYVGAFVCGFLISLIWWSNASTSGKSRDWQDGPWYAIGAATGTISGLWLTRWWYGP